MKIYGGEVHDIGIALLYLFMPAFYCDTTDALLFPNKWHRLWVNVAGIYVEGFVCAGATALWVASYPDTLLHELAYKTMLFTGISTVFFNINPLIKIDGYHALTSLLEMPDLREESFRYIGLVFQKHVLRLNVQVPVTTRRRRRIYWIYGPLALLYLGVVMSVIGGILYNLYNKTVPDFAIPLLVLTLARLFKKRVRLVLRTTRLFYLDKKEYLMSRSARPGLSAFAVLLLLVLLVPFSRETLTAEGVLAPATRLLVEAPEDGIVEAALVRESDVVRECDVVVRMSSRAMTAAVARDAEDLERSAGAARAAQASGEAADAFRGERNSFRALVLGEEAAALERPSAERSRSSAFSTGFRKKSNAPSSTARERVPAVRLARHDDDRGLGTPRPNRREKAEPLLGLVRRRQAKVDQEEVGLPDRRGRGRPPRPDAVTTSKVPLRAKTSWSSRRRSSSTSARRPSVALTTTSSTGRIARTRVPSPGSALHDEISRGGRERSGCSCRGRARLRPASSSGTAGRADPWTNSSFIPGPSSSISTTTRVLPAPGAPRASARTRVRPPARPPRARFARSESRASCR